MAKNMSNMIQYGRILVQHARIWSNMVGFGAKWSDFIPTVVKKHKQKKSEMSQHGLEMVPIASGGPGNLFLLYNNAFLYHNKGPFSYYLLPLFPC